MSRSRRPFPPSPSPSPSPRPSARLTRSGALPNIPDLLQRGLKLHQNGQLSEAAALYQTILKQHPRHIDALHFFGLTELAQQRYTSAETCLRQALEQQPLHPFLWNNLGEVLRQSGRPEDALPCYQEALRHHPNYPEAHNNLGSALLDLGQAPQAEQAFRLALQWRPDYPEALFNLANLASQARPRRFHEADDLYRHADRLRPDWPELLGSWAYLLKGWGKTNEALALYRRAAELAPDNQAIVSTLLLTSCYAQDLSPQHLLERHRHWASRLIPQPQEAAARLDRPINRSSPCFGFVSGDLRQHSIAFFLLPWLKALQARGLKTVLFSNHPKRDDTSVLMASLASKWEAIDTLNDSLVAQRIREHEIDVLIDLSGHTGHHRLGVFALRPAPVQLTWIGYMATTGVDCFDGRLCDELALPGEMQNFFTEPLWPLQRCQWVYQSPNELVEPVREETPGQKEFRFGGLHANIKLNDEVLRCWVQILQRCPQTTLTLMSDGVDIIRDRMIEISGQSPAQGPEKNAFPALTPERFHLLPTGTLTDYLASHNAIDLMLDAFPFSGGTTTFHSLWMGVPVLTLASDHPAGRGGLTVLQRLGQTSFVCHSVQDYIERAVDLASRPAPDTAQRQTLRQHLLTSELCDGAGFVSAVLEQIARHQAQR